MSASVAEAAEPPEKSPPRSGTVQSIERAFGLLETMADHGGTMGLSQLAAESGLPLPTIHRLLRTLVDLGYLRQDSSRQYVLGPRLIRLGESSARCSASGPSPHLDRLVAELGESANLAMLDGDEIVYVAQAQSRRAMRMFTEVGRRVLPHCTAVGKAIMARMPEDQVLDLLRRTGMPRAHREHHHRPRRLRPGAALGRRARLRHRRRGAGARRALRRRGRARRADQARTLGQRAGHPDDARGHRTHVPDPARRGGRPLPRPLLTGPRPAADSPHVVRSIPTFRIAAAERSSRALLSTGPG